MSKFDFGNFIPVLILFNLTVGTGTYIIAIYGPMIFTRMFLMQAKTLQGPLEGLGLESRDFFGPLHSSNEARAVWARKSETFMAQPFQWPE